MDFNAVLSHHLLDHTLLPFTVGGLQLGLTKHLVMMWLVGGFLFAALTFAAHGKGQAALLLRTGFEAFAIYLRDSIVVPCIGEGGRRYLHYFATLFLFILFCNIGGLIPIGDILKAVRFPYPDIGGTVTGNFAVTCGLAVCTLVLIVVQGIRAQHGVLPFLRHFIPLPPGTSVLMMLPIGGLLFVLEVLGVVVKCGVLALRLFVNMIAGHCVALGFMSMIFIFGAVSPSQGLLASVPAIALVTFVNTLELLVSLLQAFIFTLLSAVFVGMVSQHAH